MSSNAASEEGAAVTNSGNSSDLLADSDAPEEVVINVDSSGAWDGKPRNWPVVAGYDWAPHEVRQISSSFYHRRPFRDFASSVCLVKAAKDASHFKLVVCQMIERVCHGRENYPTDFFYAYATMFKDLKVLLPFSDFQMGVLRELNVAPTELHPNGWAFISYKDFKGHFFKVVPLEAGYQSFCFPDGQAKFLFYWTNNPKKVISWPKLRMTPEDLDLISQLSLLPPKSSSRTLIGFLRNKNLPSNVFDGSRKEQHLRSPVRSEEGNVRKTRGGSSRAPTTAVVPATSLPIQKAQTPPPTAKESSAESKRAKRSLPNSPPLSRSLSPNTWVAKRIHFDLFAEEKALVSGMTEEEASNMGMASSSGKKNQDYKIQGEGRYRGQLRLRRS
ncbi:hypothetical protein LR48_Vigan08g063600 [Vigna angularis]|uniref:Uncharacterized protein n=1 Tax=Phaseolus angularis TaxID=3914 RepID=A0A0L9V523_PHAAN|nr:hypothetical protein LR48_Vigan08g063600 [Vigna angularis]